MANRMGEDRIGEDRIGEDRIGEDRIGENIRIPWKGVWGRRRRLAKPSDGVSPKHPLNVKLRNED